MKTVSGRTEKLVRSALGSSEDARNDDRVLILKVWESCDFYLTEDQKRKFLDGRLPHSESITRARRKLQEGGEYKASPKILEMRNARAATARQELKRVSLPKTLEAKQAAAGVEQAMMFAGVDLSRKPQTNHWLNH